MTSPEATAILEEIKRLRNEFPESYKIFADLVSKNADVNAKVAERIAIFQQQIIENQSESRNLLNQIVDAIETHSSCSFEGACAELDKMLKGEDYRLMEMIRYAREHNVVKRLHTVLGDAETINHDPKYDAMEQIKDFKEAGVAKKVKYIFITSVVVIAAITIAAAVLALIPPREDKYQAQIDKQQKMLELLIKKNGGQDVNTEH